MGMLQAHSPLWHYLWVAPNVYLFILGLILWRRGTYRLCPAFFLFSLVASSAELICYSADMSPYVSNGAWWYVLLGTLLIEGFLKFGIVAEIFEATCHAYSSVASLGRTLIRGGGALLLVGAIVVAMLSPQDGNFAVISADHLVQQTIYVVETGLLVLVFAFATYFALKLKRHSLGIALGLAISSCVHLAVWGVVANGNLSNAARNRMDLLNMAAYHIAVVVWCYYLLVPRTVEIDPPSLPPTNNNLAAWNSELERLLHR